MNPNLAAEPECAFKIAALYWQRGGLNELADKEELTWITKRINGGLTGLAEREKYYAKAKVALGISA